jgi:hypothetical protein
VDRRPQSAFSLGYREARAIALIVAVVLWSIAVVFWLTGSGVRSIAGPLKGGDFVQFYAMGAAVAQDPSAPLYDVDRLHRVQVALVPASAPEQYLPVYPPQTWLLFVPLTALPFGVAAVMWTAILIAGYAWVVRATWLTVADAIPDGRFVAYAAAAFPPFWNLVINGQNTIVPLAAFFLAWRALAAGHRVRAGIALGLLFFKPTFGLALAAIVLLRREWRLLAGLLAMAVVQCAAIALTVGLSSIGDYVAFMWRVAAVEHLVEPDPFELHSLRAVAKLAPGWLATVIWLLASGGVIERTWRVWRGHMPLEVRMGLLVTASVLASPHLFLYDAAVLILPGLWFAAWFQRDASAADAAGQRFWTVLPTYCFTLLVPTALFIKIQISVFLLLWLHLDLSRIVRTATKSSV